MFERHINFVCLAEQLAKVAERILKDLKEASAIEGNTAQKDSLLACKHF